MTHVLSLSNSPLKNGDCEITFFLGPGLFSGAFEVLRVKFGFSLKPCLLLWNAHDNSSA